VALDDDHRVPGTRLGENCKETGREGEIGAFVAPTKGPEEKKIDVLQTSTKFMKLVGYPKTLGEYVQPSSTFCNLQKFSWIVNSLHGPSTTPGQYHYLRRALARLSDLNERLPEQGRVIFSDAYVRTRLIRAARQVPPGQL